MEKVKVTKEVAEAIEALRCSVDDYGYWRSVKQFEEKDDVDSRFVKTRKYFNEDVSLFIRAMFGDYEIEKTPEEKVREYFESLIAQEEAHESVHESGAQFRQGWQSVRHTLELLGIRIEGVNT